MTLTRVENKVRFCKISFFEAFHSNAKPLLISQCPVPLPSQLTSSLLLLFLLLHPFAFLQSFLCLPPSLSLSPFSSWFLISSLCRFSVSFFFFSFFLSHVFLPCWWMFCFASHIGRVQLLFFSWSRHNGLDEEEKEEQEEKEEKEGRRRRKRGEERRGEEWRGEGQGGGEIVQTQRQLWPRPRAWPQF